MLPQAFQPGEVRDNNDNIVSPGAYGKNTPLVTADNQGILDYIINNFAAIKQLVESTKQDVESTKQLVESAKQDVVAHNTDENAHRNLIAAIKQDVESAKQDVVAHNTDASAHRNLKAVDAEKADGVTVTDLGNFKGKTIGELKAALKNWIMSSNSVVKMCSFGGVSANSIINWDSENTIIEDGIIWTVTTIAANSYETYNRILISSYSEPLFVAVLWNGEWLKLLEIPLKGVSTPGS